MTAESIINSLRDYHKLHKDDKSALRVFVDSSAKQQLYQIANDELSLKWEWFWDDEHGGWQQFENHANLLINQAILENKPTIVVPDKQRSYTIDLSAMKRVSHYSTTTRPIRTAPNEHALTSVIVTDSKPQILWIY